MDFRRLAVRIAVASGIAVVGSAGAEPLPKDECDRLKAEHAKLEAAGAKDNFTKGASWGRANLGGDRLRQVERYIMLEEQLVFRCGLASSRIVLPFAEEDAPPVAPDEAKTGEVAPATAPKSKPKPKPKPKAATAADAAPAGAKETVPAKAPATQPAAAKPAPKPKPKVDDAYKPPAPANPAADPFAGKVQPKSN